MTIRSQSIRVSPELITQTATVVAAHLEQEYGETHSEPLLENAVRRWLDRRFDLLVDEMPEVLTRPSSDELIEFRQMLYAETEGPVSAAQASIPLEQHEMFRGYRAFSAARLAAMMAYISAHCAKVYKTKLNKLLFYSDFSAYYLTGAGISGARYVNLPFGPVPDGFENIIDNAAAKGLLSLSEVAGRSEGARKIGPGAKHEEAVSALTEDDRRIIDWAISTYGSLETNEIVDASHSERAYSNTRPNEAISYRYAHFLKTLPPSDLLHGQPRQR